MYLLLLFFRLFNNLFQPKSLNKYSGNYAAQKLILFIGSGIIIIIVIALIIIQVQFFLLLHPMLGN